MPGKRYKPPASVEPGEVARFPRVRFLRDTVHPDYGEVKRGEVLAVDRAYVLEYSKLRIAEETDDGITRHPEAPSIRGTGKGRTRP